MAEPGAAGGLLELVHSAHQRYSTLQATVREWQDQRLARMVFGRQRWGWRGPDVDLRRGSRLGGELLENRVRLWAAPPERPRFELEAGWVGSAGAYHSWAGLDHLLRPRPLFSTLEVTIEGQVEQAGRRAVGLRCVRRAGWLDTHPTLLDLGDDYAIRVDAERGTLLRVAARVEGREFQGQEVLEVAFDENLPEDVFLAGPPAVR